MDYHNLEEECLAYKLVKERYHFELQQKNELNHMVSIPAALISGISAFIAFVCSSFPEKNESYFWYGFFIFFILSIIGLILALIFLFRHQLGRKYEYVSSPQEIYNYEKECEKIIKNAGIEVFLPKTNNLVSDFIFERYAECAETNKCSNNAKKDDYRRLMLTTVASYIVLTIAFACKMFITNDKVSEIKIKEIPSIEVKMNDDVAVKNNSAFEVKIKDSVYVNSNHKVKRKRSKSKTSKTKKETYNDCIQQR
ncbi:MAG: hypothetical protein J6Y14_01760 [Fibrobacter sp.]|nr:hypothetical protein [Fibrobacter sp.]